MPTTVMPCSDPQQDRRCARPRSGALTSGISAAPAAATSHAPAPAGPVIARGPLRAADHLGQPDRHELSKVTMPKPQHSSTASEREQDPGPADDAGRPR